MKITRNCISDPDLHHDDVIKWKRFPRYWPFVRGIHRSQVKSPHKGQWRGAPIFSLISARIHGWVNNGGAGDLSCHRVHYDAIVMSIRIQYLRYLTYRFGANVFSHQAVCTACYSERSEASCTKVVLHVERRAIFKVSCKNSIIYLHLLMVNAVYL